MKNGLSGKIITFVIVGLVGVMVFFGYNFSRDYEALKASIQKDKDAQICPAKEIKFEKIVSKENPWSEIQPLVKDTVVQIFSQIGEFNWLEPYKTPNQAQATGTGFFINDEGHLITNAHVIDQAKALSIQIPSLGKQQLDAEVIGVCYDRDIALLKLKPEDLEMLKSAVGKISYLKLGDSNIVQRASEVLALGYPLGQQSLKSTRGVVSGRESILGRQLIQIDAAINPGNSGGPVMNLNGEVVGIATAGIPSAQNIGYIIPINELKIVKDDLYHSSNKLVRRPFLGVFYNAASEALTKFLGNPLPGGSYVTAVYEGSLLDKVGIKAGDMIYEVNGQRVDVFGEILASWCEDKMSLVDYVSFISLGQEISMVVYRKGVRKEFKFKFEQSRLPAIRIMYPEYEKIDYEIIGGMVVMQLARNHLPYVITVAPELIKYEEAKNQTEPVLLITHVMPDSQSQRSRVMMPGTLLKEINGIKIKTLAEFRDAVRKSMDSGYLTVKTHNDVFTVFPFKRVLEDEVRLSKIYRYPVTASVHELIKEFLKNNDKSNEQKTVGSADPNSAAIA